MPPAIPRLLLLEAVSRPEERVCVSIRSYPGPAPGPAAVVARPTEMSKCVQLRRGNTVRGNGRSVQALASVRARLRRGMSICGGTATSPRATGELPIEVQRAWRRVLAGEWAAVAHVKPEWERVISSTPGATSMYGKAADSTSWK